MSRYILRVSTKQGTAMNYQQLSKRAEAKNIKTFGDICDKAGVSAQDIWPGEDVDLSTALYNCDAALGALESLATVGLI